MSRYRFDISWRSFSGIPATFRPYSTLSSTVNHGNNAPSWNTIILSGPVLTNFFPSSNISPSSGFSKPANILRKVDFPHPDGPTIHTNSPSLTVRLTPPIALRGFPSCWKYFTMFLASILPILIFLI